MDTEHLRFDKTDGSVSLRTRTRFRAKKQLPSKSPSTIFIPNLAQTLTRENVNQLLCPVGALKCYLDKTKAIRKNRTRLFIPIKGDHNITKRSVLLHDGLHLRSRRHIGNWLREICHSLKLKPANWELCLPTSWAYFNSIPIEEVIQAAVWSNQTTFARSYLRDMHRQQHDLRLLGPVVAAQKVVGGRGGARGRMIRPLKDANPVRTAFLYMEPDH